MATWIVIVVLLTLFALARFRPLRKPRKQKPPPEPGTYHGVEVKFPERGCCGWVRKLQGARLLPHQARLFPLPLPECDAAQCRCRYEHFDDRRVEDDRRIPFSALTTAFGRFTAQERRSGRERRSNYVSEQVRIISHTDPHLDFGGRQTE